MLFYMSELDICVFLVIAVVFFGHKLYNSFKEQEPKSIVKEPILKRIKKTLQNVKVNRREASIVEVDLHRFMQWEEETEWNHEEKIPIKQLKEYLDNLLKTYQNMGSYSTFALHVFLYVYLFPKQLLIDWFIASSSTLWMIYAYYLVGITLEDRQKWNKVYCIEDWTSKIVEWKLNAAMAGSHGNQQARYGIIGFSKSTDGNFVDCMFAIYTIKFRLAPTISWRESSFLWWKSYKKNYVDKYIKRTEIEKFQNFLQLKALTAFKKVGIIEEICYADQTEKTDTNTLHIN